MVVSRVALRPPEVAAPAAIDDGKHQRAGALARRWPQLGDLAIGSGYLQSTASLQPDQWRASSAAARQFSQVTINSNALASGMADPALHRPLRQIDQHRHAAPAGEVAVFDAKLCSYGGAIAPEELIGHRRGQTLRPERFTRTDEQFESLFARKLWHVQDRGLPVT